MLTMLHRKVLRNLWGMRAQAVTISLIVASGVATFVSSLSTYESLRVARDNFYRSSRFADVFADLSRAPLSVGERIREIPGLAALELRIVKESLLDVPGEQEPVIGRFVSLPAPGETALNHIHLRNGRFPRHGSSDEVLINEAFAEANGYRPGDQIAALFHGRYRTLRIVGTGLSPEYIFVFRGATPFPDDRHFGIFWMPREALATAEDMEGSFNSLTALLSPNASQSAVLARIDQMLGTYGGLGAYHRSDQSSHIFITNEMGQNQVMAFFIPMIFLGVAAFLINVVFNRLASTHRSQIATLKAVGYSGIQIAWHYLQLIIALSLPGALLGILVGAWLGSEMTELYKDYFKLPDLKLVFSLWIPAAALLVSMGSSLIGGTTTLYRIQQMQPAEAMRPPAPPVFRRSIAERLLVFIRLLSVSFRLAFRNLVSRPLRTALSFVGLCLASVTMILGFFWIDSLNYVYHVQFHLISREDALLTYRQPLATRSLQELQRYPGVLYTEGYRVLPIRLHAGHRSRETAIMGVPAGAHLRIVRDRNLKPINVPPQGLLISQITADTLDIRTGDTVNAEIMEGARKTVSIRVAGIAQEIFGGFEYMDRLAVGRLVQEGDRSNLAALLMDPHQSSEFYSAIRQSPMIDSVSTREGALRVFRESTAGLIQVFAGILISFAMIIAFGVVYNTARVSLSERAVDLATLRVLGFRRGEVFAILAWELALLVIPALIPGCAIGYFSAVLIMKLMPVEGIQFPVIVTTGSFAWSMLVIIVSSVASAWLIRLRMRKLDLIGVLKVRE